MMRNKIIIYIIPLVFLSACIKPFTPKIDADSASKVVVSGKLTDKEGYQTVSISKSIAFDDLKYQALSNCTVSIWDEYGNEFQLAEYMPGEYHVWMNLEDLNVGIGYHIKIITPEGDELQSEPDIMTQVASVNIPYYENNTFYNGVYNSTSKGLQFLVDVEGDETTSSYYLFELEATYEHHAAYDREWYYGWDNGEYSTASVHHIYPPDSSLYFCWTTKRVPEIITLSTENLTENRFDRFNLHFVPFRADDLTYGYSLLLRQIGLSREAFLYWERMRLNNNQNASLYSKQPVDTQGNIKNITHPEKEVLGFFSASAISEQRIFVGPMPTNPNSICAPAELGPPGFRGIERTDYPAFLMNNPLGRYLGIWLPNPCVDCSYYSGTTIKPDFWPY